MSLYIVRLAQAEDYDDHVRLCKQLSCIDEGKVTKELYESYLKRLPSSTTIYVICDHTNRVCGTLTLLVEEKLIHNFGKVGHIEDVVVDSAYRGLGLGRVLVEHATNHAKMKGCYKVILNCADYNLGFYEKIGFRKKGNEMATYFEQ